MLIKLGGVRWGDVQYQLFGVVLIRIKNWKLVGSINTLWPTLSPNFNEIHSFTDFISNLMSITFDIVHSKSNANLNALTLLEN